MKYRFLLVAGFALLANVPVSATTVTYSTNFEAPTFTPGAILTQNPLYYTGQGGWGGYNAGEISTTYAHSGTQSLKTTYTGGPQGPEHALDDSGTFPNYPAFVINSTVDWWVQAWVRVTSNGGGVTMTLANGLGSCPLISISGTGNVSANGCIGGYINGTPAAQGANVLDQWILLQMVHTTAMTGINGSYMEFRVIGDNVNLVSQWAPYSGPGSGQPNKLVLRGGGYWDDVSAGYGMVPSAAVPVPAAIWLLGGALGVLGCMRVKVPRASIRRHQGSSPPL